MTRMFSKVVEQMSARDSSDTHLVIGEIFRAMDVKPAERDAAKVARYAVPFPYVNGRHCQTNRNLVREGSIPPKVPIPLLYTAGSFKEQKAYTCATQTPLTRSGNGL